MLVFLDLANTQHIKNDTQIKRQNPKQNLEHIPLFFQENILVEMLKAKVKWTCLNLKK